MQYKLDNKHTHLQMTYDTYPTRLTTGSKGQINTAFQQEHT